MHPAYTALRQAQEPQNKKTGTEVAVCASKKNRMESFLNYEKKVTLFLKPFSALTQRQRLQQQEVQNL